MEQNPEHDSTIEATRQNILELIDRIKQKIITMEAIIDVDKRIIGEHIRRADKIYGVDYQLDRSDYDEFKKWLEALKNAKGVLENILENIELNSDTIIEQGENVVKAQKLLEITSKKLPERQDRLIKSNADRFDQAVRRKEAAEKRLTDLEKKLEELQSRRDENKKFPVIVRNKFSIFMSRISSGWKDSHDLPYSEEETENEIRDIEAQITQAETELEQCCFKSNNVDGEFEVGEEFEQQRSGASKVPQVEIQEGEEILTAGEQGEEAHNDGNR